MEQLQNQLYSMKLSCEGSDMEMDSMEKSLDYAKLNVDDDYKIEVVEEGVEETFYQMECIQESLRKMRLHCEQDKRETAEMDLFEELLLVSDPKADLTLILGGKVYLVIKYFLQQRSSFIQRRFAEGLYDGRSSYMNLRDLNDRVVLEMLRYIYTGTVKNFRDIAGELLTYADAYDVNGLRCHVEDLIHSDVDVNNVLVYLEAAHSSNSHALKNKLINFVARNLTKMYYTREYTEFKNKHDDLRGDIYVEYSRNNYD